jgi:hypothetical protein
MIERADMETAIGGAEDFIAVRGPGSTEALELHLQAVGIAPEAVFLLIDHLMVGQEPAAADAVAMLATQAAAVTVSAAEMAREREAR